MSGNHAVSGHSRKVTVSDRRALIGNCGLSLKADRKPCGYLIFYYIISVENIFGQNQKFVKNTYATFFYFSRIFFTSTRSNDYGST